MREAYASIDVESAIAKVKALGEAAVNWRDIIREYREGSGSTAKGLPSPKPRRPAGCLTTAPAQKARPASLWCNLFASYVYTGQRRTRTI